MKDNNTMFRVQGSAFRAKSATLNPEQGTLNPFKHHLSFAFVEIQMNGVSGESLSFQEH
jgi:hypothetical protein